MVDRIFPRLDDLMDIHLTFLNRLLTAQRKSVDRSIHDIGHIIQQQVCISDQDILQLQVHKFEHYSAIGTYFRAFFKTK